MQIGIPNFMVKRTRSLYRVHISSDKFFEFFGHIESAMGMCRIHESAVVTDPFNNIVFVPKRFEYDTDGS